MRFVISLSMALSSAMVNFSRMISRSKVRSSYNWSVNLRQLHRVQQGNECKNIWNVRWSYERPWYLQMPLPFPRRHCRHTLPHPFAPSCTTHPKLPASERTPRALRCSRWERLCLVFLPLQENRMFLRQCGGGGCYRAEEHLKNEGWDIVWRRSSYQCKTEHHEWLHLVPIHRRPMVNHSIKALDIHVVGRCHVPKSRESFFLFHFKFQRKQALHGLIIEHIWEITGWHVYLEVLIKLQP